MSLEDVHRHVAEKLERARAKTRALVAMGDTRRTQSDDTIDQPCTIQLQPNDSNASVPEQKNLSVDKNEAYTIAERRK